MESVKKISEWIVKHSPGYEHELDEARTKTSKMLYARRRVSFTRIFAPGSHIEAEEYIMDKRLKGGIFKHFRYFGPRSEFLFYLVVILIGRRLYLNNLGREENIESVLNDRNVFLRAELPLQDRQIK